MLVIVFLIRALLATVLVTSGVAKLAGTQKFTGTLVGLGIPARQKFLLRWLTLVIPLIEIGIGIMSISGFWPTVINGLLFLLMSSFTIVVSIALLKKLHIECRCFGSLSDSQFSRKGLAQSIFLTFLAAVVFWSNSFSSSYIGGSLGSSILLIAGYIVFAVVVMEAAQTITLLKEEIS